MRKKAAIIVLNWNGLEDTRACAASLAVQTYRPVQVYLVDNASSDDSTEALADEFPQFTLIANQENLGFTGGNNAAMERALSEGARYVLLLNNDTIVAPDFLEHLVAAAETDRQVGMVGPKILYHDAPDSIWYAGGKVDFSLWLPFRHIGEDEPDRGQYDTPSATDFVTGCCLLVRAETIRQIGMLDPAYGYYGEDVDWCLRARKAGWRVRYAPRARVWHKVSRSMRRGEVRAVYYNHRNALLVARRHLGAIRALPVFLHALKWTLLGVENRAALVAATWDAIIGREGLVTAPDSSRFVRGVERVFRLPARVYWWAHARQRGGPNLA